MSTSRLESLLNDLNEETIVTLPIRQLEYLQNSPFKIYDGERKAKLMESISENGLISPIVVIPSVEQRGMFKILCGANRVDAYKQLNIDTIQAVIKNDLSEDEAMLIVIESNLFNRSIDDMLPSELALTLSARNNILKHKGKEDSTLVQLGLKLKTVDKLGEEYKLSASNIKRYIRLTFLNDELLEYVDTKLIAFNTGVEISYLKQDEQNQILYLIKEYHYSISLKIAEQLKVLSSEMDNNIDIRATIDSMQNNVIDKPKGFKLTINDVKDYIPDTDLINAKDIIIKALKLYYVSK
jgi:ParB family chromosome partitioning protein